MGRCGLKDKIIRSTDASARKRHAVSIIGTRGYPSYYGGFETAVRKLGPYLAEKGWAVTVFGRPGQTKPNDPSADLRVKSIDTPGIDSKALSTLSYGLSASLLTARSKPDAALIMNVANGFWLPLLRLRGIPTVVNVDGIEWERAKWGGLAKTVFKVGARLTAKFADLLIFDSVEIAHRWNRDYRRDGMFIPYGGDPTVGGEREPEFAKGSYVLLVARFVPENSVGAFFEAVPKIAEHYPVVIVGSEGNEGPFDLVAKRLDKTFENVSWLGHLSDDERLASLWRHCGLYFHGHSVGGTNPALVQAMALGAPVLARDTVYNREVLGDAGKFVHPSADSIRAGVLELMAQPNVRNGLAVDAELRAAHAYSWGKVNELYLTALLSVVKAKKANSAEDKNAQK